MKKPFNKNMGIRRGVFLLPNLITTASLFCAFFSMVNAINGDFRRAAWMILLAGLFDLLDGRVARLTRTTSDFGVQYDSLCDLASFGLAPAILAYTWTLHDFKQFGWAAAFLFFACAALRLARYNVQSSDVEKKHFQGLPTPPAAYLLATYVLFYTHLKGDLFSRSYLLLGITVALSLLMVSNVRYRSFKTLNLKRRQSFFVLVAIAVGLFIVTTAPSMMLFLFTLAYLSLGIIEEIIYQIKKRSPSTLPFYNPDQETPNEPLRVVDGKRKTP